MHAQKNKVYFQQKAQVNANMRLVHTSIFTRGFQRKHQS